MANLVVEIVKQGFFARLNRKRSILRQDATILQTFPPGAKATNRSQSDLHLLGDSTRFELDDISPRGGGLWPINLADLWYEQMLLEA